MNKRSILIYVLILIVSLNMISYAENSNKLIVAGDNNYPPYEFVDDKGEYRGFNVDIMRAIAFELGYDLEFIPTSWENANKLLLNKNVDLIQGMTDTPERELLYNFSQMLSVNSQNIFVLSNTTYISKVEDLRGKKVSFQADDVTKEILNAYPEIIRVEKIDQPQAIEALLTGEVDAFIGNRLTGIYHIQRNGLTESIKMVGEPLYTANYGIAVLKENPELINLLNKGIDTLKSNGTYDKIYHKWFGEVIVDTNRKWRNLFRISLIGLALSMILIMLSYVWNKRLKEQVEIRTKEIVELNKMVTHNDKMQALGNLSSGIAHELRNPLTSIKAFVDLIPAKINDNNFRTELLRIVPQEIKRMEDLIGSLLNYSKPRSPKPEKILLHEIISDVLILLKQKLTEKDIKIVEVGTNTYIYVDESQFKQILINILMNSADAFYKSGVIELIAKEENGIIELSIIDDGVGIPEDIKDKIFDPFYSSKNSGFGIGLSITERLVKDNNGTIKIESKVGQYTKVIITLPANHKSNR